MSVREAQQAFPSRSETFWNGLDRWTPLHEPSHLALWEGILGSEDECRIVVAWDAMGQLAAYAPLMRVRGQFGPLSVPTLRFIGNNIGYPGDILYTEVFSDPRDARAAQAILGHVASTWSLRKWELGYLSPSSPTWRAASRVLGDGLVAPRPQASVPFVSVRLPAEWDAYFASLTANTRSTYRRGFRHLDAHGGLKVVIDRTAKGARQRVEELIRNHVRWLRGTERERWFGDADVKRFLISSAELLAREGHFLASALELNGTPIAWVVGPVYGGTCFAHLSSYDRTDSEDSPGLVLGLELMRELIARGYRRVQLGPGPSLYKKRLGGEETPYVQVIGYQGWTRRVASARELARIRSGE